MHATYNCCTKRDGHGNGRQSASKANLTSGFCCRCPGPSPVLPRKLRRKAAPSINCNLAAGIPACTNQLNSKPVKGTIVEDSNGRSKETVNGEQTHMHAQSVTII